MYLYLNGKKTITSKSKTTNYNNINIKVCCKILILITFYEFKTIIQENMGIK